MEINRYEEYKKELNQILELNTYITFKDFLNVANEIYENNFLNFDFPIIMVKNKYYNWRNKSNKFKKESIYHNNMTKNNNIFLRNSTYKFYQANGKTFFKHEHIIFISNYFIRK